MSLLPDRATVLLSPCRLTGCRVTDRSSQDAGSQTEKSEFTTKHEQRRLCFDNTLFQSETRLFSLPKQKTLPETDAMNWVKSRSVSGRSTRETSRDWGCRARPAFTSDSGRDTWTRRDGGITWFYLCWKNTYIPFKINNFNSIDIFLRLALCTWNFRVCLVAIFILT